MQRNNLITPIKMASAGAVAFLIYALFNTDMGFWSVVTIAAITQASSQGTLVKSIMRTLGTLIGALLGFLAAKIAHQNPYILIPSIFCLITLTSFFALQNTIYGYAGIVAGMTIAIILFYSVIQTNITQLAVDRSLEILMGVAILLLINCIILFYQKQFFSEIFQLRETFVSSNILILPNQTLIPALKVSCASLITFLIWYYFHLPEGYWSAITCLLIMEENVKATFTKAFFRFSAHVIAVVIAFLIALAFAHTHFLWKIFPLIAAFFACGYLISSKKPYASMGNTIAIAVSIMLVSSPDITTISHLIFARFYNVLIGISIAFLALSIPITSRQNREIAP